MLIVLGLPGGNLKLHLYVGCVFISSLQTFTSPLTKKLTDTIASVSSGVNSEISWTVSPSLNEVPFWGEVITKAWLVRIMATVKSSERRPILFIIHIIILM